jgi:hypothetical protein
MVRRRAARLDTDDRHGPLAAPANAVDRLVHSFFLLNFFHLKLLMLWRPT